MKAKFGRKQAVLAALVVFLGVAVFVNWYYTKPENKIKSADSASEEDLSNVNGNLGDAIYVDSTDADSEYFANAQLSRDASYDEAVATLKTVVDSSDADEKSVRTAADTLNKMSEAKIAQTNIENLVKSKTGSACVAIVNDDSVDVIVSGEVVNSNVILQIKDIVMNNTDVSSEKITIIGAK